MDPEHQQLLWALGVSAMHALGVLTALSALLTTRSSQSAIAWIITCVVIPYLAVPAYWLLGNRFSGYVLARRSSNARLHEMLRALRDYAPDQIGLSEEWVQSCHVFEQLAAMPFTRRNRAELLIDGEASFESIFRRIEEARDYILVQFFIVRSDALGWRMQRALAAKVQAGVRAYFLYDQIGCHSLSKRYLNALAASGVQVRPFKTNRGWWTRFQVNFRNHRKMVLVDGRWAATGGANLGVEYCGHSRRFGYWRDTMIAVQGPAVQEIQLSFVEDWFFVSDETPELNWRPQKATENGQLVLVLPTGPADELHTCSMMFTQAIHSSEERLWITTPYFVPDNEIIRALQLAALRGVDVRILLQENPDHRMVYWASFTYLAELERTGVKFFRYTKGLLHEKVVLVDDQIALVGSANTDNRSFYLNFELTLLVADKAYATEVEAMLNNDWAHSRETGSEEFERKGTLFRLAAHVSRLLSPVL